MAASATFFSVAFEFIMQGKPILYDLYVNSSGNSEKERFVRIFPIGEVLLTQDLNNFKEKYPRLYIPESQRTFYLQGLLQNSSVGKKEKTQVIKDSAIHYLSGIFDSDKTFTTEVLNDMMEGCKDSVANMVEVIKDYDIQGLQNLIGSLSFHDFYTFDHSINVSMYCIGIYRAVRPEASKEELILAGMGGLLHDLGKIKIPTEIINFSGKLTDEMFNQIKLHPQIGKELLESDGCACEGINLDVIKRVVYEHHENVNGTGYPNQLQGENIHIMAKICAIADFFDAVTTKRSYHDVMSVDDALHLMSNAKGKKLDPKIFDLFAQNAKVIIRAGKANLEMAQEFDPCQPQTNLPLKLKEKEVVATPDFGKIKIMGAGKKG